MKLNYNQKKLKKYNALCKENKEKVELLNQIKTKLYYELEKIDLQEILQNKELTEKQKLYVALAINEKRKNVKNIKEIASLIFFLFLLFYCLQFYSSYYLSFPLNLEHNLITYLNLMNGILA